MKAFQLALAIASFLIPLSADGSFARQIRSVTAFETRTLNASSSRVGIRSGAVFSRTLPTLWSSQPANVRVSFAGIPDTAGPAQVPPQSNRSTFTPPATERASPRNRLHLRIRTPLGWVRVRLAS